MTLRCPACGKPGDGKPCNEECVRAMAQYRRGNGKGRRYEKTLKKAKRELEF